MSQFFADERPLTPGALPDGSPPESSDLPPDVAHDCYKSPLQPQIATRADEVQTDDHELWASTIPDPEVTPPYVSGPKEILHSLVWEPVGCLPDRPEAQVQNRASFHFPGNSETSFESRSGRSSFTSVHFFNDDGGFVPPFKLLQQPVSMITRTPAVPLHSTLTSLPLAPLNPATSAYLRVQSPR